MRCCARNEPVVQAARLHEEQASRLHHGEEQASRLHHGEAMHPLFEQHTLTTRRQLLQGVGLAALTTLLGQDTDAAPPQFAPRAKRIVYLMQGGAPSHVDLFDYKPELAKRRGQELPASVQMGQRLTTMTAGQKTKPVLPGIAGFKQYGKSGAWLSDFLPHTGSIADDLCFIKSMHTEAINHAP